MGANCKLVRMEKKKCNNCFCRNPLAMLALGGTCRATGMFVTHLITFQFIIVGLVRPFVVISLIKSNLVDVYITCAIVTEALVVLVVSVPNISRATVSHLRIATTTTTTMVWMLMKTSNRVAQSPNHPIWKYPSHCCRRRCCCRRRRRRRVC